MVFLKVGKKHIPLTKVTTYDLKLVQNKYRKDVIHLRGNTALIITSGAGICSGLFSVTMINIQTKGNMAKRRFIL